MNPFSQACRYLAKLDPVAFIAWLLKLSTEQFEFRRWLDTRLLRFPGEPDRTCDTVAFLEDLAAGHVPWAIVVEFQIEPDSLMFGRFLGYLGPLWIELKPNTERGDRFFLGAVVVNLTGHGEASRMMDWPAAEIHTGLGICERNLAGRVASAVLADIEKGSAPAVVLPFIPLMQGGGESATIDRWKALAGAEPDARRRGDYGGLALVFAEAGGCAEVWKSALKEWNVIQSKQVQEWQEQARKEGRSEGAAAMLVRFLNARFGELPSADVAVIQAETDQERLAVWLLRAAQSTSLDEWRHILPETRNGTNH